MENQIITDFILSKFQKDPNKAEFSFTLDDLVSFMTDFERWKIEQAKLNNPKEITIELIADCVCEYFNTSLPEIRVKTRKREIVFKRQCISYLAKKHTKLSLQLIGNFWEQDHATMLHAKTAIANLVETDKTVRSMLIDIERVILEHKPMKSLLKLFLKL